MKFRMVDRILDWEPCRAIRGVKAISFEEYQLREPLGYAPYLPESLILESLFQLANWLVILSTDYEQASLGSQLQEARFLAPLRPGSSLFMDVSAPSWRDDSAIVEGIVSDRGQVVATVRRCILGFVPVIDHYDPDDLRALYSEICRPEEPGG